MKVFILSLLGCALACGQAAFGASPILRRTEAAVVTWTGEGDGIHWSDPHNWSNRKGPGPDDVALIGPRAEEKTLVLDVSQSIGRLEIELTSPRSTVTLTGAGELTILALGT